jgi:hypothetical protein
VDGLFERRPGREGDGHHGQHGIARTGVVIDGSGACGEAFLTAVGSDEQCPIAAECDDQGVELKLLNQFVCGGGDFCIGQCSADAHFELGPVGCHCSRAGVARPVAQSAGIDEHRFPGSAGGGDDLLAEARHEHAFGIIFQTDHIRVIDGGFGSDQQPRGIGLRRWADDLIINAEDLLAVAMLGQADHAGLGDCGSILDADQAGGVHAGFTE